MEQAGAVRDGSSFYERMGHVSCWNSVMTEDRYLVQKRNGFIAARYQIWTRAGRGQADGLGMRIPLLRVSCHCEPSEAIAIPLCTAMEIAASLSLLAMTGKPKLSAFTRSQWNGEPISLRIDMSA